MRKQNYTTVQGGCVRARVCVNICCLGFMKYSCLNKQLLCTILLFLSKLHVWSQCISKSNRVIPLFINLSFNFQVSTFSIHCKFKYAKVVFDMYLSSISVWICIRHGCGSSFIVSALLSLWCYCNYGSKLAISSVFLVPSLFGLFNDSRL